MNFIIPLFFLILILSGTPFWEVPLGFDAHKYQQMVFNLTDPFATSSPHHWQRLLPPLCVRLISSLSSLPPQKIFYALTYSSFYFFTLKVFYFIKEKIYDQQKIPLLSASLTFLVIFHSWAMVYPLGNIYQLCDLWCMLFTLLMLEAFMKKNYYSFFLVGLLSIFTRQNLIIIVALGHLYFFHFSRPFSFKRPYLVLTAGALLHLMAFIILFTLSPIQKTLQYLILFPSLDSMKPIKSLYHMISPYLLILLFEGKKVIRLGTKYFPILFFMMITIYQPMAAWSYTGLVNLERIIIQGLWIVNLTGAILVGRKLMSFKDHKIFYYFFILFIPLILGTKSLDHYLMITFPPLFFMPNHFKNNLIIIITLPYLINQVKLMNLMNLMRFKKSP